MSDYGINHGWVEIDMGGDEDIERERRYLAAQDQRAADDPEYDFYAKTPQSVPSLLSDDM